MARPLNIMTCTDCGRELLEGDVASTSPVLCESCRDGRAYEIASADVVLPLSRPDAEAIAEALELFAGIDEGENTDYDNLLRLAGLVRRVMLEP